MACHVLIQGNFQTQGLNLHHLWLQHCRQIFFFTHGDTGEAHTLGYSAVILDQPPPSIPLKLMYHDFGFPENTTLICIILISLIHVSR